MLAQIILTGGHILPDAPDTDIVASPLLFLLNDDSLLQISVSQGKLPFVALQGMKKVYKYTFVALH